MQKLCYILFDGTKDNVSSDDQIYSAFDSLLDAEKGYFETNIDSLTPRQKSLMKALANERTQNIYATDYIKKHNIGSIGGIQQSVDTLSKIDLITKENKTWKIVDPVMEVWLKEKFFSF
jgi:isopentenyl phosphate kinase